MLKTLCCITSTGLEVLGMVAKADATYLKAAEMLQVVMKGQRLTRRTGTPVYMA